MLLPAPIPSSSTQQTNQQLCCLCKSSHGKIKLGTADPSASGLKEESTKPVLSINSFSVIHNLCMLEWIFNGGVYPVTLCHSRLWFSNTQNHLAAHPSISITPYAIPYFTEQLGWCFLACCIIVWGLLTALHFSVEVRCSFLSDILLFLLAQVEVPSRNIRQNCFTRTEHTFCKR